MQVIVSSQRVVFFQLLQGPPPSPRYNFPMAAINDTLYVFGGVGKKINNKGSSGFLRKAIFARIAT
jgi:hypothetical protein